MLTITREPPDTVVMKVTGKLTKADYDRFVPEFERLAETAGPLRVFVELDEFQGWEIGALWEELKFDVRHQKDLGRVAVVGESRLEEWGTKISKPFFRAEVKYFSKDQKDRARQWLNG